MVEVARAGSVRVHGLLPDPSRVRKEEVETPLALPPRNRRAAGAEAKSVDIDRDALRSMRRKAARALRGRWSGGDCAALFLVRAAVALRRRNTARGVSW
jgi:hypothetical protein